ncbi:MAG: ABC transporter permease [Actinomycetaceae bacterium]|nr:ABC transporter permease [Actinomycetaceae bacterium]
MNETTDFSIPGKSLGIWGALKNRFLLQLLVHKELRIRYRGSILGMLWSYAKPATQFIVFYVAIGQFMGMNRAIENYVVYMFAGVVIVNYFSEIFNNGTRSIVVNSPLVKKIYLPRELFPLSSVWVAFVHFIPQAVILIIGALIYSWRPTLLGLGAILLGIAIITVFSLGLGLISGALNVFYRDAENFVELFLMMATWASPVLYKWQMVEGVFESNLRWLWYVYQLNPITTAVELFHYGFWGATAGVEQQLPPSFGIWILVTTAFSFALLALGEMTFRKLDGRFAQEL